VPTHTIAEIQGTGPESPFAGSMVATTGVVTARWTSGSSQGFFVQMPRGDGDPRSSDGLFVFTGSVGPPPNAAVGVEVCISGRVAEFRPAADPGSAPITEIDRPAVVLALGPAPLPAPVTIGADEAAPDAGLDALERFEGMRVRIEGLTASGPTGGEVVERDAEGVSNGVFFGVVAGTPRPFREPGVDVRDTLPEGAPPAVPRFDGNPERIRVDSDALGGARLDVGTGALVAGLVGPLHYAFRTYTVLPEPERTPSVTEGPAVRGIAEPAADEIAIASFNLQRLFDTTDEPGRSDVVVTADALARRLAKLSLTIRDALKLPDVIGVQEAENLAVLQALADRLNADRIAAGQPDPGYRAELVEGQDPGGIDVGVLVKTSRVAIEAVSQEGRDATFIDPGDGRPEPLNDRPPLIVRLRAGLPDGALPFTLVVNHLRSLTGIAVEPGGARVRAKRRAQAEFLAALLHARQSSDPSERIVVVGDFNAFEFNDGFVDVVGTIRGAPADPDQAVLGSSDLVDPDLTLALEGLESAERYTYVFEGSAQSLDHVLLNRAASAHAARAVIAHGNADAPEALRSDATRPERSSDHDVPIVYLRRDPSSALPERLHEVNHLPDFVLREPLGLERRHLR
jgi:predicted extracellular nuclease